MPHPNKETIQGLRHELNAAKEYANSAAFVQKMMEEKIPALYETETKFNRSGTFYIANLEGVKFYFDFIKANSKAAVLDAGTTTGKGIMELSKTLARDTEIYGVGLRLKLNNIPENQKSNFFLSNFENLRRLKAGSLGGIISTHGVFEYSTHPQLVVHKSDRLLAPCGVLKFVNTIDHVDANDIQRANKLKLFQNYYEMFRKLGYAVAQKGLEDITVEHENRSAIFLAIKQGENTEYENYDAENLLLADWLDARNQIFSQEKAVPKNRNN